MATLVAAVITSVRNHLVEPTANFWTDAELLDFVNRGVRDLWRDIVDLKQEHYLTTTPAVTLLAGASSLSNVPTDVHKVYLIEATNLGENGANAGLHFQPLDYNHQKFAAARARPSISPANDTIYFDIHGQGAPVNAPTIRIAPTVTTDVAISFSYVPTLVTLLPTDLIPVPGEADNAITAWAVAFARAKERDDRSPDPNWLSVYTTEKQHLLESLGLRQYQEPKYVDAQFEDYW